MGYKLFLGYFAIAALYFFYSVATYECTKIDLQFDMCRGNSIMYSYFSAMIWPGSIAYDLTHK